MIILKTFFFVLIKPISRTLGFLSSYNTGQVIERVSDSAIFVPLQKKQQQTTNFSFYLDNT